MEKHLKKSQPKQGKKKFDCLLVNPPLCSCGCYEKTVAPMVPTQLVSLATTLRKNGFQANVLDLAILEDARKTFWSVLTELEPSVVGFSNHTVINLDVIEKLAQDAKECGAKVILGGVNPTNMGEETLDFVPAVDHLFKGFCEGSLLDFFRWQGNQEIWQSTQYGNALETPDIRMLQYLEQYSGGLYPLETQRGCRSSCAFCTSRMGVKPAKNKPRKKVLEEIKNAYAAGFREFFITDNTFTEDWLYTRRVCDGINRMKEELGSDISFMSMTRLDCLDENMIELLIAAGVRSLGLGYESACADVLEGYGKRLDHSRIHEFTSTNGILEDLMDYGMETTAFVMVGGPDDTDESLGATYDRLACHMQDRILNYVTVSMFRPFPGTPYWKEPDKFGLDFEKTCEAFHSWGFFNGKAVTATRHLSKERIEQWAAKLNGLNPETPEFQF